MTAWLYPVVLYAADTASMATALTAASGLALPASDITGDFDTAWGDLTGGSDLVIAVGQAAVNALYYNPCGWPNPAGTGAGSTPFSYSGEPLQQPPGAGIFESSDGSDDVATATLTLQLTQYAMTGALPNEGAPPLSLSAPAQQCLGSPDVTVP